MTSSVSPVESDRRWRCRRGMDSRSSVLWMTSCINHGTNHGTSSAYDSLPPERTSIRTLWTGGKAFPQLGDSRDKHRLTQVANESRRASPCSARDNSGKGGQSPLSTAQQTTESI